jgi:hypothetical protein
MANIRTAPEGSDACESAVLPFCSLHCVRFVRLFVRKTLVVCAAAIIVCFFSPVLSLAFFCLAAPPLQLQHVPIYQLFEFEGGSSDTVVALKKVRIGGGGIARSLLLLFALVTLTASF